MRSFIPERRAVNSGLSFSRALVNAVVSELPPCKEGAAVPVTQNDLVSWADKEFADTAILVAIRRVVLFIEREAVNIAILR